MDQRRRRAHTHTHTHTKLLICDDRKRMQSVIKNVHNLCIFETEAFLLTYHIHVRTVDGTKDKGNWEKRIKYKQNL